MTAEETLEQFEEGGFVALVKVKGVTRYIAVAIKDDFDPDKFPEIMCDIGKGLKIVFKEN